MAGIGALNTVIRANLTIIDATRILLRNGPQGGNIKDVKVLDTVLASPDPVAAEMLPHPELLRPPGTTAGADFFSKCVRCGECMKVCIQNALQPCFMESGYEGIFTPKLVPRLGYCEFNCTLCGQVCPTGAIHKLNQQEKKNFVIGIALIDKQRCLPFADSTPCIVCEEHCPTYDKAIKFNEITAINRQGESILLIQPYVITELCIGCGICENKCPLPGNSAIRVFCESDESTAEI